MNNRTEAEDRAKKLMKTIYERLPAGMAFILFVTPEQLSPVKPEEDDWIIYLGYGFDNEEEAMNVIKNWLLKNEELVH